MESLKLTFKERSMLESFLDQNPELADVLAHDILTAITSGKKTIQDVLNDFMDIHMSEEKEIPEGATTWGSIRN